MAIENKYGKSAVDATRRNSLPPWLDTVLGTSGAFLPISGGTLTGELKAPSLLMLKQNSTNEGGEIKLEPATSSWPTTYLDSCQQYFRVHDGSVEILKLDLQSDNKSLVIPRGSVWAGDGASPTVEVDCGVNSSAGSLYLYSSPTSGNRGIWINAHGTGAAKNIIRVDTNNNVTFFTHYISGQIQYAPSGGVTWIKGRDAAALRMNSIPSGSYVPLISTKGSTGSWEMGCYYNSGHTDRLYFTYAKDTNYNSSTNTVAQAYLAPRDSGVYAISLASMALSGTTLTITDPQATVS